MRRIVQFVCSAVVFAAVFAASVALVAVVATALPPPEAQLVNRFVTLATDTAYLPVLLLLALGVLFVGAVIGIALVPARHVWNALRDNRTLGEIMTAAEARAKRQSSSAFARPRLALFGRPAPETAPTRELHV
jgi:hypothetical protein